MKKITNKGFTLIELLVVVAIIAILALVVLLALNPAEMARKTRDSRRLSDMGTLRRAIDLSLADNKTLPVTVGGWITINSGSSVTNFGATVGLDISKYLSVVPEDPLTGVTGTTQNVVGPASGTVCTLSLAVANTTMIYEFYSDGTNYELRAKLESADECNAVRGDGKSDGFYELGTNPGMTW